MTQFNFEKQLKIEEEHTPLILRFLEESTGLKPVNVRDQCLEYDFLLGNQRLDLKADTRIAETGNFFIETESIRVVKKGWLYNENTDQILYLDTKGHHLYFLDLKRLQQLTNRIQNWPFKTIPQENNYITAGHVIPVDVLTKWFPIKKANLTSMKWSDFM